MFSPSKGWKSHLHNNMLLQILKYLRTIKEICLGEVGIEK